MKISKRYTKVTLVCCSGSLGDFTAFVRVPGKADNAQSSVMSCCGSVCRWTFVPCSMSVALTNSPHAVDARFAVCRMDHRLSIACTIAPGFSGSYTACERATFYRVNASCHLSNHANGARVSKSYYMVTNMVASEQFAVVVPRLKFPQMTSSFQGAVISAKYPKLQYKMIDTRLKVFRPKPFHYPYMGLWDTMKTGNLKSNFGYVVTTSQIQ